MPDLESQLYEDRLLRDSAKAVLSADVDLVKGEANPKPKLAGLVRSAKQKAGLLAEDATEVASDKKVQLVSGVALVAGVALAWVYRDQLREMVTRFRDPDTEPDVAFDGSEDE